MACQYFYKEPGSKEGKWYTEEELITVFRGIPPHVKWWEEPEFKKRNPLFNHEAYLNSVNKFGENFENLPEHLQPRLKMMAPDIEEGMQYQYKMVAIMVENWGKISKWEEAKNIAVWDKMQKDLQIPKNQLELLKNSPGDSIEEKFASFLANYSFVVEINTAKTGQWETISNNSPDWFNSPGKDEFVEYNSQLYANLTVPGGTNYTENEIATPAITPSIKGHAAFSTNNGIGWFRSDDKIIAGSEGKWQSDGAGGLVRTSIADIENKTRRILEVQSDLFQKGRDKEVLLNYQDKGYDDGTAGNKNKFLALLNKDNNWVTFFVKSIIQDSAKKGYEKVLFPSGNTASKIEGHITLEEFKKQKEDRIKELEKPNESVSEIYNKLGNKTKEGNVVIQFVYQTAGVQYAKSIGGVFSLRVNGTNNQFGNPFSSVESEIQKGLIRTKSTKESVEKYIEWLLSPTTSIKPEQHKFIREWLQSGKLKGKPIVYYKELREPSHATALDYLINKYDWNKNDNEINQLKQELERVEKEGFAALKPIYKFYNEDVANILKKQGYTPKQVTDEYGNTWNEVEIKEEHKNPVMLQKQGQKQSKASPKTIEKVKELLKRNGIDIQALDAKRYGGINGVANFLEQFVQIAEGMEDVALTEEAMHFIVEALEQGNPALYKKMLNKISKYKIYSDTKQLYQNEKAYQNEDGSPNILKIKKEAIGKLLAEYYINKMEGSTEHPELLVETKSWWQEVLNFIKNLLRIADINPFEQAINEVDNVKVQDKTKEYAEMIEALMHSQSFTAQDIIRLNKNKQYSIVVNDIAEQLKDNFDATVQQYLGGDRALGEEILEFSYPLYQLQPENTLAQELKNKFKEKIDTFNLQKHESDLKEDEDSSSYYTVVINGKEQKTGRTTEWAKSQNIKFTKNKDFFENLSPEQKKEYGQMAKAGVAGHFDIQRVIESATNADGTLKPKDEVSLNFQAASQKEVAQAIVDFMLGTSVSDGWLSQFPAGSVFLTEQQVFNDKASSIVDGKKVQGRAGTIDLLVITPDKKVFIYDWKFMGMAGDNPSYQPFKQSQHKLQLADYKRTLKEAYGLKIDDIKAFTIPIASEYTLFKNIKTGEKSKVMTRVLFGDPNLKKESRLYLIPVAPDEQSTGNKEVDELLSSLRGKYKKIYEKVVSNEERPEKIKELNYLSNAIRSLHITMNFEPLSIEAKNYEKSVGALLEKYKDYDASDKSLEELKTVLAEISSAINTAEYYSNLDQVFSSVYSSEELTKEQKDVLNSLRRSSSVSKEAKYKLTDIIKDIIDKTAEKNGINSILSAEKEVGQVLRNMTEASLVPMKSLKFLVKVASEARSADEIEAKEILEQFGIVYEKFIQLAKLKNVKDPLSLIADLDDHLLISKVDKTSITKAKKDKNKKDLLANVNIEELKKIIKDRIEQEHKKIDDRVYSQDERLNAYRKEAQKTAVARELDIFRDDFTGWNNRTFNSFINKTLKEEENYTKEYRELLKPENKSALDMYDFITTLNERAISAGYIPTVVRNAAGVPVKRTRFLGFVNATLAQRLANSENKLGTFKQSIADMFTVQEYEEQGYGKKDEETGEIKREVPAYYTGRLDKDKKSNDLLGIMPRFIEALVHFETSVKLEDLFQAVLFVEETKGHLEVENGRVVFEGDTPKSFKGNVKNAEFLKEYIDYQIYGINSDYNDLVSRLSFKYGSKENAEKRALSTKKTIQAMNRWTQQLAVGLKFLVAIPNYLGSHFQALINSGRYYKGSEYEKNHFRWVGSKLGGLSEIEKGLLDMVVPLNGENFKEQLKGIAFKQSTRKYLSTVSQQDVMMSLNRIGDISHQISNALSWLENTMLDENGKLVNIREYLSNKPEYKSRYSDPASLKSKEKDFEKDVENLKNTKSLKNIAKWENDLLVIPGLDKQSLASYRNRVVEYGRRITSQMSKDNRAAYQSNILVKSFMMFKNWIIPQVQSRASDIHKDPILDQWEYGRMRLFVKTLFHIGFNNILKIKHILKASPEGIEMMRDILEQKREDYYNKTGQQLEITEEEFFDMMRQEIQEQVKELQALLLVLGAVFGVGSAQPPVDDLSTQNKFKLLSKLSKKAADELRFYYSPLSAQSILQGSIFPSLGILSKASKVLEHSYKAISGDENAYPTKYLLNLIPVASQFQNELLPIIDPEMAKSLGIKTTAEARVFR